MGRAQSRALGARWRDEEDVVGVWTSPMSRAVQTAELAAGALGLDDVVVRRDLREYGVGAFAGRGAGGASLFRGIFDAWLDGDTTARIPDGEVIEAFAARLGVVLEEVATHVGDGTAAVVTHGGAIGTVVTHLVRDLPAGAARGRHLPNCSSVVLERDRSGWRLLSWPDARVRRASPR